MLTLCMFRATLKTLKQLLRAFSRVCGSFTDCDAYFKALTHFLKLQLGKVLFRQ